MKKAFSLVFMFFAFALLVIGCSNSPETVAKKWGKAIIEGDLKEANKYTTEETSALNPLYISWLSDIKQKAVRHFLAILLNEISCKSAFLCDHFDQLLVITFDTQLILDQMSDRSSAASVLTADGNYAFFHKNRLLAVSLIYMFFMTLRITSCRSPSSRLLETR